MANAHIMWGPLFVSESAAAKTTNLTGQPAGTVITGERGLDFAGKTVSGDVPDRDEHEGADRE